MDKFRLVPPSQLSDEEKLLQDDLFLKRGSMHVTSHRPDYKIIDPCIISTGHGLKIYRCNLILPEDPEEFGIIVYWEYPNKDRESSFYIGQSLLPPVIAPS